MLFFLLFLSVLFLKQFRIPVSPFNHGIDDGNQCHAQRRMSGRTAAGYYFPSLRSFIPAIFRKFVFGD